jgi:hypothetical protein
MDRGVILKKDFHLKYANRCAELVKKDPNKWIPLVLKHLKLFLKVPK